MEEDRLFDIRLRIIDIIGRKLTDLPDMQSFGEMVHYSSLYKVCYLRPIEKAQLILKRTRAEISSMRWNSDEKEEGYYALVCDYLSRATIEIIDPLVHQLLIDTQAHTFTYQKVFAMHEDVNRLNAIVKELSYMDLYRDWEASPYVRILRRVGKVEKVVHKHLQVEYFNVPACL